MFCHVYNYDILVDGTGVFCFLSPSMNEFSHGTVNLNSFSSKTKEAKHSKVTMANEDGSGCLRLWSNMVRSV